MFYKMMSASTLVVATPYNGAQYYAQPALSGFDLTAPIGGGLDIELTVEPGVQNTFTFGVSRLSSHALARFAVLEDSLGTLRELTSELITKQGSNLMKFQPTGNTVILHISNEDLYNMVYISIVDWYKSQTKTVQETILVDVCDEDKDRYRFGYTGHEKINEIAGIGNTLDMGNRWLLSQTGRTPSLDAKAALYPGISPYAYALNTPLQAKDPDGKVVIFINGQHTGEGGKSDYWRVFKNINVGIRSEKDGFGRWRTSDVSAKREVYAFDKAVMDRIGDHKAIYRDGAMGGFKNTLSSGDNLDVGYRQACGVIQGMKDAKGIIANLQRDANGNITESIKIISHSMGAAYSKGYAFSIMTYAKENKINGVNIEFEVDFAPFQPNMLKTIEGVHTIQASHKYDKVVNNIIKIAGSEEEKQEGVNDNDYHLNTTDKNKGHSIFNFSDEINTTVPQSTNNPK